MMIYHHFLADFMIFADIFKAIDKEFLTEKQVFFTKYGSIWHNSAQNMAHFGEF